MPQSLKEFATRRRFIGQATLVSIASLTTGLLRSEARPATQDTQTSSKRRCSDKNTPMRDVKDKVAFVTGGSSGIGFGIVKAFVDADMRVVIGYRTKRHLEQSMAALGDRRKRVHSINVDVTDRAAMERAAKETVELFGKVHVVVNNAGIVGFATVSETTYDDWEWMMNVNVNGVFNGLHAFLPLIRAHGEGGQIITTASIGGLVGGGYAAAYTTSKFAVVGLMETLRSELLETNIGVSVFCPGGVTSNIMDSNRNRPVSLPEVGFNRDKQVVASVEQRRANPELTMDPLTAGRFVLEGMRNNDLYILTHSRLKQLMQERHEAIMSSFPTRPQLRGEQADVKSSESFYAEARDRRMCDSGA